MMALRRHRHPPITCPHCSTVLRGGSLAPLEPEASPKENDACICEACGEVSVFTAALQLRVPTDAELDELRVERAVEIEKTRAIMRQLKARHEN